MKSKQPANADDLPVHAWRIPLRLESACALAATLVAYEVLFADWRSFATYFLLPDLSLLAYLLGPRAGSATYNAAHSLTAPVLLAGASCLWPAAGPFFWGALIWGAHVHFDRALGYGLKRAGSFRDTHLGMVGRAPRAAPYAVLR